MAERTLSFEVECIVEDTDTEETEVPTEMDVRDWMESAAMAWSAKGINMTDCLVSINYDSADVEPWEDEEE